jgi:hypothetical protein
MTIPLLAYFISTFPIWFYASALITAVHTAEEARGAIWNALPIHVPIWSYFLFQLIVLVLGSAAILSLNALLILAFIVVRVFDTFYTHVYLYLKSDAPGIWTAPLLLIDVYYVLVVYHTYR